MRQEPIDGLCRVALERGLQRRLHVEGEDALRPFHDAGFDVQMLTEKLPTSQVWIVIASKGQPTKSGSGQT